MRRIDPTTLYETPEVEELLTGFVSLDLLRKHGLRAMPGRGYWGNSIIASIERLCENALSQPRGVSSLKETNDAFFEKQGETDPHDRLLRNRTPRRQVESQRDRPAKRPAVHDLGGGPREVESQRDKLSRLSKT